jgi:hypothetical protein
MKNPADNASDLSNADLLCELADEVSRLLSTFGTSSSGAGDYRVDGTDLSIPSVEVLIFQTDDCTADVLMACSTLLDAYPENFRIRFIEAAKNGKPLEPLGGLSVNRYGPEIILSALDKL